MTYVEFPFDQIFELHVKKKDEPPDGEYPAGAPYCGRYGYGARMEEVPGLISAVPYGPNQQAPMIGTFPTSYAHGGINHPLPGSPETFTAAPFGLHVFALWLGPQVITFSNNQLIGIQDEFGKTGLYGWVEHMATGQSGGIAIVVKSYTINLEWAGNWSSHADGVGLGFTHIAPGYSGPVPRPAEPAEVLGSARGGSGSFFYDFKAADYWHGNIEVDEGNQFDPGLGGPAYLWWMSRRGSGSWGASAQFMTSVLLGLGDWYTWEIIAECQLFPAWPAGRGKLPPVPLSLRYGRF